MLNSYYTEKLLGLQEVSIKKVNDTKENYEIFIEQPRKQCVCPVCGKLTDKVHDYRMQRIKELSAFEKPVVLVLRKRRYACSSVSSFFNAVLNLIQNLVTYIYLISEVLHGMISIGSFTMYVSAVTSFSNAIKSVITSILDIKVYGIYYNALEQYLSIKETMRENEKRPLPDPEHYKIEFRNVSFRYPGQSTYALKNINITIGAGEKLSVVGENGSGKTTFIKLLCRLYDPTEGEILFNGINIREIDYDAYIRQFAAVFQDFKLFSFSVKDNIVWGDDSDSTRTKAIKLTDDIGLGKKSGSFPGE